MHFFILFHFVFESFRIRHNSLLLVHISQHQEHAFQLFEAHVVSELRSESHFLHEYIPCFFWQVLVELLAQVDLCDVGVDVFINHLVLDNHENFALSPHFGKDVVNNLQRKHLFAMIDKAEAQNGMLDLLVLLDFFPDPLLIKDAILYFLLNLIFSDFSQLLSFHGLQKGGATLLAGIALESSFGDDLPKHQILNILLQLESGLQNFQHRV